MTQQPPQIAIQVRNLVKEYEVYARPLDVAMEVLTRKPRHTKFRALDDLTFDVERGEVLGVIGSNGAGKSTLLKIVTGVLDATAGQVDINGRVTAILELGLGFNPEYTGRENIYLSGLLYGMQRAEVDSKIDAIIAFSGLGDFIERPVKTYSSGMHSRLAFSIATAVDPDILIIDEALAAGDAAFVQKCLVRIRQLCSGGRTVLLVSHGTGLLAQLCNRVMWIEQGRLRMLGPAIQVVQAYDLAAHQAADASSWIETVHDTLDADAAEGDAQGAALRAAVEKGDQFLATSQAGKEAGKQVFRRGPVFIEGVDLVDQDGALTTRLTLLKPFAVRVRYRVDGDIPQETLGVALAVNNRLDLTPVAQFMTQNIRPTESRETYADANDRRRPAREGTLEIAFPYTPFRKGVYFLSIGLLPNLPGAWSFYEYRHFYYEFSVDDAGFDMGAPVILDGVVRNAPRPAPVAAPAEAPRILRAGGEETTLRGEIESICGSDGRYPDAWPRHAVCPACAAPALRPAFSKYGFTHERCAQCGFVCVNPYPPQDTLAKLYDGAYYTQVRELFEAPMLRDHGKATPYSAPLEALEEMIARATGDLESGAWLDVGGGLGAFVDLIRRRRPRWRVRLNELNRNSIALADELFDIEAVDADAQALRARPERYDVISSVAVAEHTPDPLAFLRDYAELLKPGGWLVTALPHFTDLNAAISRASSPNCVPPYHLSLFNEASFRALLSRIEGLELVDVRQAGQPAFSLMHHVPFGDRWDVSIPTAQQPEPRSIQIAPYDDLEANALAALGETDPRVADYFARTDGRLMLIGYCRKRG